MISSLGDSVGNRHTHTHTNRCHISTYLQHHTMRRHPAWRTVRRGNALKQSLPIHSDVFSAFSCFPWCNNPSMDFPHNILRRLFFSRPGLSSSFCNGGLWLSSENQTKTGMLMRPPSLPKALFSFLLCYTPGISKKAPVWWKLLAAL